jgi:alkanesulfonate monooxygenase SsuD/methylene tetrahydromethanopterin reductase-like flavin-dependent oxidoreductase (luciferase family)
MTDLVLGINVPASASPGADPVGLARVAESGGFDFVSASDHPCGTDPTFETWTMLTWIAASTSRIKVATRVLGVPYRAPAMVAKMAETLDRLSGGRFILGLGGGYSDNEFRAFGLGVPSARDKVDGLAEAIAITRGLWSEAGFTFAGRLHQVTAADIEPKPGHHIPIWLGTFGDRALAVTGRHADGWIPSLGQVTAAELEVMRAKVLAAARQAGRDPADVTCALNVEVHIGSGASAGGGLIAGSPGQVTDSLLSFAAAGFTAFNFMPVGERYREQVEQIAAHVLPVLRTAA